MSRNFLTPIVLPAGTASSAPLTLQAGTNLTTPAAGAVEFDGKVLYTTPASRGVSPSMMFYRLNSNLGGANTTAVQSLFGAGVTLAANTVYAFETNFVASKSLGTTSHSFAIGFGGTATVSNILYAGTANGTITAPPSLTANAATVTATTASIFTVSGATTFQNFHRSFRLSGTVSINTAGTFIPQYQLSAAPGGAYSTLAGSYFAIWPIGEAGANTSVGPWA
jgi:hypothetical protein